MDLKERIERGRIVPVIVLEDAADAAPLCEALRAGGLEVAEITFRTPAAREALAIVKGEFPEFALGAGTVTTLDELEAAVDAGAQFAVAPGLNPRIVRRARELGLPFFPGVCTPSEIEAALDEGCQWLKFFPAGAMGGVKTIKALSSAYAHRGVRFLPTGGVTPENLADYLHAPGVVAVGGSWLVDKKLIQQKDWETIQELTRVALGIAQRR